MQKELRREFSIIYSIMLIIAFMVFSLAGGMLNIHVISINDGRMPVDYNKLGYDYSSDAHFTYRYRSEINKFYLADNYKIANCIWSVGDFMIIFGAAGVITGIIRYFYIVIFKP